MYLQHKPLHNGTVAVIFVPFFMKSKTGPINFARKKIKAHFR